MKDRLSAGSVSIKAALCRHSVVAAHVALMKDHALTCTALPQTVRLVFDSPSYALDQSHIRDDAARTRILAERELEPMWRLSVENLLDRLIDGRDVSIEINILGTTGLLRASRRNCESLLIKRSELFRILLFVTDEVHCCIDGTEVFTHKMPIVLYSSCWAGVTSSEKIKRARSETFALSVLITKFANSSGSSRHPDRLIRNFIIKACEDRPISHYGAAKQANDRPSFDEYTKGGGGARASRVGCPPQSQRLSKAAQRRC